MSATELRPRSIRPVPSPHAVYLRPGRNDHTALLELLAERVPSALAGVVLDPTQDPRHEELHVVQPFWIASEPFTSLSTER